MSEGGRGPARRRALAVLAACAAAAVVAQWLFSRGHAALGGQYEDLVLHRNLALLLYLVAVGLVVWLCRSTRDWPVPAPRRGAALAIAVLLLATAVLRFHRLEELPPGLWIDEALNGVQAVQIAQRGRPLVALPIEDVRTGLGAGFVDVAALPYLLGDPSDGPWTIRAVAAVFGILGVAAAAALAWRWFGPLAAVAATAWLMVSQWHLNYSRWGEMPIMSPLVETLVALGVTVGLRQRGARGWAAWLGAGVAFGLGLYTYQTYRLWAGLALAVGIAAALWQRHALRGRWAPMAAALVAAALVATPMVQYALAVPGEFGERAAGTLIFLRDDWRAQLAESLPRSLLAFQFIGDDNPRHNLPFAPLLGFGAAVLAPLGLAACAARWRQPACAAVLLWFAAALVPAVITLEAPHATRLLDAIVPLALGVGLAVQLAATAVAGALAPRARWVLALLAVVAAGAALRGEWRTYFVDRERLPGFFDAFFPHESAAARYLAAQMPNATVYLDPETYWHPALPFVARRYLDQPNDIRRLTLLHDFPPREPLARDALYLLPRPYASFADVLRALSPATACETQSDPFGRVDLVACTVPRDEINRAIAAGWQSPYGLRGRIWSGTDGSAPIESALPFAYCAYGLNAPPLGPFTLAEWDGSIDVPRDGEYLFRLHPDSTTLDIGGRRVIDDVGDAAFGGGHDGRVALRAGRHPLRITLRPGAKGFYFLWLFWEPPGEEGGWVPAARLHPPAIGDRPTTEHLAPLPGPG
jgi:hypothetical protein